MKKILIAALAALLLGACGSAPSLTRAERYPQLYKEQPITLLVMPPINHTTHEEAKELLYSSISRPLIEAGYYVLPPAIVMDLLQSEDATHSERFLDANLSSFHTLLGAHAVVFSVIDTWTKIGFGIDVDLTYIIKSTLTNEVLFERRCDLYLDLHKYSYSSKKVDLLIDLAVGALSTALTEHIVAARKCNYFIFQDLPYGKYSPYFNLDQTAVARPKLIERYDR